MNRLKITTAVLVPLASCSRLPCKRNARDKETHLTINQPLQVQNTVLAPGQYVFKLAEPDVNQRVVTIFSGDGIRPVGTIVGSPAFRTGISDKTQFTVAQPAGNQPGALKYWFSRALTTASSFP